MIFKLKVPKNVIFVLIHIGLPVSHLVKQSFFIIENHFGINGLTKQCRPQLCRKTARKEKRNSEAKLL